MKWSEPTDSWCDSTLHSTIVCGCLGVCTRVLSRYVPVSDCGCHVWRLGGREEGQREGGREGERGRERERERDREGRGGETERKGVEEEEEGQVEGEVSHKR